jgi:hypothetical protein
MPTEAVNEVADDFRVVVSQSSDEPVTLSANGHAGGGALLCFADFTKVDVKLCTAVTVYYRADAGWLRAR